MLREGSVGVIGSVYGVGERQACESHAFACHMHVLLMRQCSNMIVGVWCRR
jgi:hypothetical protein